MKRTRTIDENELQERDTRRQRIETDSWLAGVRGDDLFFMCAVTEYDDPRTGCCLIVDRITGESRVPNYHQDSVTFYSGLETNSYGGLESSPRYYLDFPFDVDRVEDCKFDPSLSLTLMSKTGNVYVIDQRGLSCIDPPNDLEFVVPIEWPNDQFDFVPHAVELRPGFVVAMIAFLDRSKVLVYFDTFAKTSKIIWQSRDYYDMSEDCPPYLMAVPNSDLLICGDETGLCVRDVTTGLVVHRLRTPDGSEIYRDTNQHLAVTEKMILLVDPDRFGDHAWAWDLPGFNLRLDVEQLLNAAFSDTYKWLWASQGMCQAMHVYGLKVDSESQQSEFALDHNGKVNFATL